ncbi:hypothetical protein V8F06_011723 [Rhypophila decipiens]
MGSHIDELCCEKSTSRDSDRRRHGERGFTPVPLRWWYLSSVLVYICLLLVVLEYSFHVIPQTSARQSSPPTYFTVPPDGLPVFSKPADVEERQLAERAPRPRFIGRRNATDGIPSNSSFPVPSNSTTKPCDLEALENITAADNQTVFEPCTVNTTDSEDGSTFRILHLDPNQFAELEPRTYLAHYRLHFVWIHDTDGRYYIPVFPGMDISQRCTQYGQYMYITTNKDDCRMLVEIDDFNTYGFHPIMQDGDKCHKEFYTFSAQYQNQWGWQPQIPGFEWNPTKCWEDEWDQGKIILYPSRVVSWPAGWPTDAPGGVGSVPDVPPSPPRAITTTLSVPPMVTEVTSTLIGADGKPTTTVRSMTIPGRVITTVLDVLPTPTAHITVGGTVLTLTNSLGQPTATTTSLYTSGMSFLPTPAPQFTTMTTILSDSAGRPTATQVLTVPLPSFTLSTTVLTNSLGQPTATQVLTIPIITPSPDPIISATTKTIYNQLGEAIWTSTGYILPLAAHPSPKPPVPPENWGGVGKDGTIGLEDIPSSAIKVQPLTWQSYFVGSFLPVLLTTVLSILVQVLGGSLRAVIPFLALQRRQAGMAGRGAEAADSLLLPLEGNLLRFDVAILLAVKYKEPLLLMSNLLQIAGMVLASLSSEAIGMTLGGGCRDDDFAGCFMSLAVIQGPARAAEGLLVFMVLLLAGIMTGIWLSRRKGRRDEVGYGMDEREGAMLGTGGLLRTPGGVNPTSILGAAAMVAGEESRGLRELLVAAANDTRVKKGPKTKEVSDREIRDRLEGYKFAINTRGHVVTVQESSERSHTGLTTSTFMSENKVAKTGKRITGLIEDSYDNFTSRHRKAMRAMEYGYRAIFLASLGTLLFIVAYYGAAQHGPDDLIERFLNSQTFGVSFLFTGAGGMIDFFWGGFFSQIELLEPYRYLSHSEDSQTASRSAANMMRPRSSSIFSGLFRAVANGNVVLSAVAFAGVLSKFLPVVLSNVPFRLTLTWTTFVVCTWISVSVLAVMILVMIASFFVSKPDMPVDVGTTAGKIYYVCDSQLTNDIGEMDGRDGKIQEIIVPGVKYRFGTTIGVSGRKRTGIDYLDTGKHHV